MSITVRLSNTEKDFLLVALTEFLRSSSHSIEAGEVLTRLGRRLSKPEEATPAVAQLTASSAVTPDGKQTKVLLHLVREGSTLDDSEIISLDANTAEAFGVDVLKATARVKVIAELFTAKAKKEEETIVAESTRRE